MLLVQCRLDAEAAATLGESAIAAGGRDFTSEQLQEVRSNPGPVYVLPDAGDLDTEAPRRWTWNLYPKARLCPADYGEGLEDLADVFHKRGEEAVREVLKKLKAQAVDALELELREAEESSTEGSQSLTTYRRAKEWVLPLLLRLEDEGAQDAALHDVADRLKLSIKPLRIALAALHPTPMRQKKSRQGHTTSRQSPARSAMSKLWHSSRIVVCSARLRLT